MDALPDGPIKGKAVFALSITWIVLCTTVIILRFWSRMTIQARPGDRFSHRRFYWDDWIALAAWVSAPQDQLVVENSTTLILLYKAVRRKCFIPRCVFARPRYGPARQHSPHASPSAFPTSALRHVSHLRLCSWAVPDLSAVLLPTCIWDEPDLRRQFLGVSSDEFGVAGYHVLCRIVQLCACQCLLGSRHTWVLWIYLHQDHRYTTRPWGNKRRH
jgi:hypothetical protein